MREDERFEGELEDDAEGHTFRASPPAEEPVRKPRDDARGKPRRGLDDADDDVHGHAARPPMKPIEASQ
jgi:hypothetical protein